MARPCPLCGNTDVVEWQLQSSDSISVVMTFECPNCDGHGTIYANLGDVVPIIDASWRVLSVQREEG